MLLVKTTTVQPLTLRTETLFDNPQVDIYMHEFSSRTMLMVKSITPQALTVRMDTLYDNPQVDMTCMGLVDWNHVTGQVNHYSSSDLEDEYTL